MSGSDLEVPAVAPVPPESAEARVSLSATAEYACYSAQSEQPCWAITSFKAPFYEPTSRAPVDIVAVIDRSGSMAGEKIKLVRETLLFVIENLKDCDRLSLVTYDTYVDVPFELMEMTEENKKSATSYVERIVDGSNTNLSGGLFKGMEQIALTQDKKRAQVQSVLLLTDGLANNGLVSQAGIIQEMKKMQDLGLGAVCRTSQREQVQMQQTVPNVLKVKKMKKGAAMPPPPPPPQLQQQQAAMPVLEAAAEPKELDPVTSGCKFDGTVYTFGFGSDHDASMLEAISTQGGGVYYYIDSNEKIPESFADCLGGLLSVMGQNLVLKLDTIGNTSFEMVHANRKMNWSSPKKSCEIQMGDLQSEEERDIVLELRLPALPGPIEGDPVISAQLSYFNVITSQIDTVNCQLTVNRTDGERGPGNMKVDIQRNRIFTTAVLKEAESLADNGKLVEAQAALNGVIATVQASLSREEDLCKALVADMKKCLESMTNQHAYRSHGKLMVNSKMQSHAIQRSNFIDEDQASSYDNFSKVNYKMKAKKIGKK